MGVLFIGSVGPMNMWFDQCYEINLTDMHMIGHGGQPGGFDTECSAGLWHQGGSSPLLWYKGVSPTSVGLVFGKPVRTTEVVSSSEVHVQKCRRCSDMCPGPSACCPSDGLPWVAPAKCFFKAFCRLLAWGCRRSPTQKG